MTRQKDLKRLVRTRMHKTGESYTTARKRILDKKTPARGMTSPSATHPATPPAVDLASRAGMSDEAVRAKTGKSWAEWVAALDAAGAARMPHRDIAAHLHAEWRLPGWWAQTVTVGYERIRGLRDVGQRRGGSYEANKSKTFPVPVETLYRAFAEKRRRRLWLGDVALEIRTSTAPKSMRITWNDRTHVDLWFTRKSAAKSQVAIQHRKLASKEDAAARRAYWTERIAALEALLSKPTGSRRRVPSVGA